MKGLILLFSAFFFTACTYQSVQEEFCLQTSPGLYVLNFEYGSALMNADAVKQLQTLGRTVKADQTVELYGGLSYTGVPLHELDITFARLKTTVAVLLSTGLTPRQIDLNMAPAPQKIGLNAPLSIKEETHRIFLKIK